MVNLGKGRAAIESIYTGTATITEYQKVKKENKTTGFEEVVVLRDQPCRLSFSSFPVNSEGDTAARVNQTIKVFMSPEIEVKPGSKLAITQNGVTNEYKNSGIPAVYASHQEIQLELFEKWS